MMKTEEVSRGRGTASIADCLIMSVETVQRRRRD
jgi:DNA-binding CsgD family transcriptional regulator